MISFRFSGVLLSIVLVGILSLCGGKMSEEEMYTVAQKHYAEEEYDKTVELYKDLVNEYPESADRPKAFFMIGYIYANHLQDTVNAKAFYNRLKTEYPDDEFVDDAEFELKILGMSPDDLDKMLQDRISQAESDQKKKK